MKNKRFRDIEIGEKFTFLSHTFNMVMAGPWIKTGNRKYKDPEPVIGSIYEGLEYYVGTIDVEVR